MSLSCATHSMNHSWCPSICLSPLYVQAGRWLLMAAGLLTDKEETEVSGVPEFPVAVRTQLLVGETSYAIQAQPAYAAAFSKMEDAIGDVLVQVSRRHDNSAASVV